MYSSLEVWGGGGGLDTEAQKLRSLKISFLLEANKYPFRSRVSY